MWKLKNFETRGLIGFISNFTVDDGSWRWSFAIQVNPDCTYPSSQLGKDQMAKKLDKNGHKVLGRKSWVLATGPLTIGDIGN